MAAPSFEEKDTHAAGATEGEPAPVSSMEVAIARARPRDPLGLLLAEASVAVSLFGAKTVGLGRFRVLERLGAGGMGVVYAAYDPDLDRGVAIKLVHIGAGDREAALAEAKALARLSHPNVVPVFDVGSAGEHVYIVMELVRGTTLRGWSKDRARSEVLAAYLEAGQGLAAAHAAGLVHRDFKPDNVVVGDDRRVRVVDFGLACAVPDSSADDERRAPAGTPRYMAPEQAAGAAVTPAADQYSFCQSLSEALGADDRQRSPLPRWLASVLERGRAAEPQARFASMPLLLRALASDPVRIWRRRILVGVTALVVAFAFVAGQWLTASPDACAGGEAELASTWPPAARDAALLRIATLSPYGRGLAPWLGGALDDVSQRWLTERRDACVASRRGVQSGALLDRRMACLARARAGIAAAADRITHADANALPGLPLAVQAIADPARCSDAAALMSDIEPPPEGQSQPIAALRERLERARVEIAAGRYAAGRDAAAQSVAAARAIGYRPMLAEALLLEGRALYGLDDRATAVPLLAEATTLAFASGADALALEAWGRRAWGQATTDESPPGRPRERALDGVENVEALAIRPRIPAVVRALLFGRLGAVALAGSRRDEARSWYERAVAEARGASGDAAVELLKVQRGLAFVVDDPVRSDALIAEVAQEQARLLGADHPETLITRFIRGTLTMMPLAPAADYLAEVCTRRELHPTLAADASECWAEVGYLRGELGDRASAVAALERALPGAARDRIITSSISPYLALWRGAPVEAARLFAAALAALPLEPDESKWRRHERAELQLGMGRAWRAAGRPAVAQPLLAASAATLAEIAGPHPSAEVLRRLGRARVELALSSAAIGNHAADVATTAQSALDWLREVGGRRDEIAALEPVTGR